MSETTKLNTITSDILYVSFSKGNLTDPEVYSLLQSHQNKYFNINNQNKIHLYNQTNINYLLKCYKNTPSRPFIFYDVAIETKHSNAHIMNKTISRGDHYIIKSYPDPPSLISYNTKISNHIFLRIESTPAIAPEIAPEIAPANPTYKPIMEYITKYYRYTRNFGTFINDILLKYINISFDSFHFIIDLYEHTNEPPNGHIVLFLDLGDTRSIVMIDKCKTITAYHVYHSPHKTLSKGAISSYERFINAAKDMGDKISQHYHLKTIIST